MGQKVQFTGDDRFSAAQFDAVARHLRAKLPTKTRFLGKKPTEYFSGMFAHARYLTRWYII